MSQSLTSNLWEKLHIAIVAEDLRDPLDEGAKKASSLLIRSMIKQGARVSLYSRHACPLLDKIHKLPDNKLLAGYSFARNLRREAPDVILYIPTSSGTFGAFIRAAIIKIQSRNVPLALLNLQYRELPQIARHFNLAGYAAVVFTQSQASTQVFQSFKLNTVTLPGGVDNTIFRPIDDQEKSQLRKKYHLRDADQILLHVGHCNPNRNVIILSRLVELGYRVIMITSTSTAVDPDLINRLQQSGVVVITDYIDSIQHFYQMADCYIFPAFHRTSAIDVPLSVLEAMSCNLPVITSRFGALPNMFQSGKGFFYADNDEDVVQHVKLAIQVQDCRTAEMVSQYSCDNAALIILQTIHLLCHS
jgi:glycosyltransferase involved in cell wall biosynthesis